MRPHGPYYLDNGKQDCVKGKVSNLTNGYLATDFVCPMLRILDHIIINTFLTSALPLGHYYKGPFPQKMGEEIDLLNLQLQCFSFYDKIFFLGL